MSPFNEINLAGHINVVFEQGKAYEVKLVGDSDAIAQIVSEVDGKSLNLRLATSVTKIGDMYIETSGEVKDNVTVYVKSPNVRTFNLAGSGRIDVKKIDTEKVVFNRAGSGTINIENVSADYVTLNSTGLGKISCNVNWADKLNCNVMGSGQIVVTGKAGNYQKSIIGNGNIDDKSLKYESTSFNYDSKSLENDLKSLDNDLKSVRKKYQLSGKPASPDGIINPEP